MRLTEAQEAVVAHGEGPARILGPYVSGRTTALRARAGRLAGEVGAERVLVLSPSSGAASSFTSGAGPSGAGPSGAGVEASTFWGLALGILERSSHPRRPVGSGERTQLVHDLLMASAGRWPILEPAIDDHDALVEVVDAVCHYQASWLGLEELRTHAGAAGQAEPWEELADLTRQYREVLDQRNQVDWAGALVHAGLALRDPAVAEAERRRFEHVVVDDFEHTSFAAHRLLASLVGPGGNIVVAGNLDAPVASSFAADRRWLERFPRSYGARLDVSFDRRLAPAPDRVGGADRRAGADRIGGSEGGGAGIAEEIAGAHRRGEPWSAMVVVVGSPEIERHVLSVLRAGGVPCRAGDGPDPWDAGDPPADAVTVTSPEGTVGRTWPLVVAVGCTVDELVRRPPPRPRLLDLELLAGPDVPSARVRAERWEAEQRRRAGLVASRATRRLVLLDEGAAQMAV